MNISPTVVSYTLLVVDVRPSFFEVTLWERSTADAECIAFKSYTFRIDAHLSLQIVGIENPGSIRKEAERILPGYKHVGVAGSHSYV
jgi:hypothetical protein